MPNQQKAHSGLGIAAFILSLLSPLFCLASLFSIIIQMSHASTPSGKALQAVFDGWLGVFTLWLWLPGLWMLPLALLLGIIGLLQKNRKKVFALAATIISLLLMALPVIGILFVASR